MNYTQLHSPQIVVGLETEHLVISSEECEGGVPTKCGLFAVSAHTLKEVYGIDMPHDGFDLLAEVRGKPSPSPSLAVNNHQEEFDRMKGLLSGTPFTLLRCGEKCFEWGVYATEANRCLVEGELCKDEEHRNIYRDEVGAHIDYGGVHDRWRGGSLHIHVSVGATFQRFFQGKYECVGASCQLRMPRLIIEEVVRRVERDFGHLCRGNSLYRRRGWWDRKPWGFEMRSFTCPESQAEMLAVAHFAAITISQLLNEQ